VTKMTLLADLEKFVHAHRPHGPMTCDATEPAWNGYLLTVACPCGVVFERWVTPDEADADLLRLARRTSTSRLWGVMPSGILRHPLFLGWAAS
jgi:hypothetical protein